MASIIHTMEYRCSDDCLQIGCPSHEAKLIYQSISDTYVFENGKGETKYFERGELEAFIELLKELDTINYFQISKHYK